jgi:ribosomal protein S18 acetylase RimI-like enzyme
MLNLVPLGVDDLGDAVEWVRAYFDHDGLSFGPHVEGAIAELLASESLGRFWVIENAGSRVGYLVLTFGFDHEFGGRIGLITDFFLFEHARGAGLGTRALELALSEAKKLRLKAIELYVLDHNGRARDLYRRFGFEPVLGRAPLFLELFL